MIQVERAEWADLRREAKRRVSLHKRSMQREADLKEQLRSTRQEVRELRADNEAESGDGA